MGLKKLGAALLVVAALSAVLVNSASAAAVTEDVKWYTGASPGTELASSETFVGFAFGLWTFDFTVAATAYTLEWEEIEFIEGTLDQAEGKATASGKLKFKGVKISKPAGCSVPSTITTKALSITPDWMSGSTNYWKFVPTAGETTAFFTAEITGCALATTVNPKGSLFFQSANATGTQAVEQSISSSAAINSAAGGSFKVGTETASLTGTAKLKLSGAKAGQAFGTH